MERFGAAYLVGKIISEEHPTRIRLPPISTELCLCEQRYFSKTIRNSVSSALRVLLYRAHIQLQERTLARASVETFKRRVG
jgi:hypothetical protein